MNQNHFCAQNLTPYAVSGRESGDKVLGAERTTEDDHAKVSRRRTLAAGAAGDGAAAAAALEQAVGPCAPDELTTSYGSTVLVLD
jgi:hypothetical protein